MGLFLKPGISFTGVFLIALLSLVSCSHSARQEQTSKPDLEVFKRFSFAFNPVDAHKFDGLHDSYKPQVNYIESDEISPTYPMTMSILKAGDLLNLGSVRKLPKVKFGLDFFKEGKKTSVCNSDVLNLSVIPEAQIKVSLVCDILGQASGQVSIDPIIVTANANVEASVFVDGASAVDKALAMALAGTLSFNNSGTYAGKPVTYQLVFLPAQSSAGPAAQIIFSATSVESGELIMQLNSNSVSLDNIKAFLGGSLDSGVILNGTTEANVKNSDTGITVTKAVVGELNLKSARGAERVVLDSNGQKDRIIRFAFAAQFNTVNYTVPENAEAFSGELNYSETATGIPATITVASYNTQGLADDSGANVPFDFTDKASNWIKDKMYDVKARRVAEAIALAGSPDVVALQEVKYHNGTSRALDIIWPYLQKQGYKYKVLGAQALKGPKKVPTYDTEAIISKYPIVATKSLVFDIVDWTAARDPLMALIDVGGTTFRVYTMHTKSKKTQVADTDGDILRRDMLALIKKDIDAVRTTEQNADVIVMGDMNASYYESSIVDGLKSTGEESLFISHGNEEDSLYNLWYDIKKSDRCDMSYKGMRDCIDNMLLDSALYDNNGLQYVDNSFTWAGRFPGLARDTLVGSDGAGFRWQAKAEKIDGFNFTTHIGVGYSDHLPIVATFKVLGPTGDASRMKLSAPASVTDNHVPGDLFIHIPYCTNANGEFNEGEKVVTLTPDLDLSKDEYIGKCVRIDNGSIPIQIVDTYDVRFDIGFIFPSSNKFLSKVSIGIQYDDLNIDGRKIGRDDLMKQYIDLVKPALDAGKKVYLTGIKGRLGVNYGKVTLAAEELPLFKIEE